MTEAGPVAEVRALLRSFLRSQLRSLHVTTPAVEIFFSRDPLIRASDAVSRPPDSPIETRTDLTAPHIGTLVTLAPPGVRLAAGDVFGRLAVLDEERELVATAGGRVVTHHRAAGDLVEHGEALLALSS